VTSLTAGASPSSSPAAAEALAVAATTQASLKPLVPVLVGGWRVVGGIPAGRLPILVRAPVPKPPPKSVLDMFEEEPVVDEWDFNEESVFRPRKTKLKDSNDLELKSLCDCRRMFDGAGELAGAKKRAFEFDWAQCLLKKERFLNLVKTKPAAAGIGVTDRKKARQSVLVADNPKEGKEMLGNDDEEVAALKAALKAVYPWLSWVFQAWAATDTGEDSSGYMGWLSYSALMDSAGVIDKLSCRQSDLDTIFKAANFEVKGSDLNDDNPLESLTRAEWLEIICRVAKAKFGGDGKSSRGRSSDDGPSDGQGFSTPVSTPITTPVTTPRAGEVQSSSGAVGGLAGAVQRLVAHMQASLAHAGGSTSGGGFESHVDHRDEWRLKEFYQHDTDEVYRSWMHKLTHCYKRRTPKDLTAQGFWRLKDWVTFLDQTKMFEDESFTREEANLCFYCAKFTVVDYVRDKARYECLDFLSFLEALGHVARFKWLPKVSTLAAQGLGSLPELMAYLKDPTTPHHSWDAWMAAHEDEESPEDCFSVRLHSLITLIWWAEDEISPSIAVRKSIMVGGAAAAAAASPGASVGAASKGRPLEGLAEE